MLMYVLIFVAIIVVFYLVNFFIQRKHFKMLTQEQFIEGYRKAQLVDVREQQEFERGHIRGARNIPLSQLKQSMNALRPDKPVYLYCQNTTRSARAAQMLRKKNYENIHILQGGFKKWTGKVDFKK